MKLVIVEWIDSCVEYGWTAISEVDNKASKCVSAGLLVKESPDAITMTTSRSDYHRVSEPITIPRCCIKRIRCLKVSNGNSKDGS